MDKLLLLPPTKLEISKRLEKDVKPSDEAKRRGKIIRLYLTAIILISAMLSYYIWQSSKMFEIKLRINTIERTIKKLENSNADLQIEISKLQALGRIENIAITDLGMIQPQGNQQRFIVIPSDWNKKK